MVKKIVVLREKGSDGINNASELRKDSIHTSAGQTVHQICRQEYCNKNIIIRDLKRKNEDAPTTGLNLRSRESPFRFSEHCIFCGRPATCSDKKRDSGIFPVRTADFQLSIERACSQRGDSWAQIVHSRIEFAQDLHALDAIYH
ncbi:hypothetical protein SNE40_016355 [Patella caerulea]|uniref:Uncharacterized protein n=1 Tax=Patella caerulea TaxID=87958 RepID=A0AAN8JE02_PATCE